MTKRKAGGNKERKAGVIFVLPDPIAFTRLTTKIRCRRTGCETRMLDFHGGHLDCVVRAYTTWIGAAAQRN